MDFIEFIVSIGSGIIIILIGIVSYLVKKDFNKTEKELEGKRSNELCDMIHKTTDEKIKKDSNKIEKELESKRSSELCDVIHKTTDEKVIRRINELDIKLTNKFFLDSRTKRSPYHPDVAGKKLLQDSGWNEIYKNIKEEIFNWIDKEDPKTLYDVEKIVFYVLHNNKDDERFTPLKEYVVNNPEIDLSAIFVVASWVVRDEYWESRKQ